MRPHSRLITSISSVALRPIPKLTIKSRMSQHPRRSPLGTQSRLSLSDLPTQFPPLTSLGPFFPIHPLPLRLLFPADLLLPVKALDGRYSPTFRFEALPVIYRIDDRAGCMEFVDCSMDDGFEVHGSFWRGCMGMAVDLRWSPISVGLC